jgi:hypothetical protein
VAGTILATRSRDNGTHTASGAGTTLTSSPTTTSSSSTSSTTPAAGFSGTSATSTTVQTNYAAPQYLADWKAVDGGAQTGRAKANAVTYEHAITMIPGCGGPTTSVAYDLSRAWKRFQTTVALRDDSDTTEPPATFAVYFDSVKVKSGELRLGQSVSIDLGATNLLRLRLEMTDRAHCFDTNQKWLVWGDPKVSS